MSGPSLAAPRHCAEPIGSVKLNVAPSPARLLAITDPRCRSTARRTMLRPTPLPA